MSTSVGRAAESAVADQLYRQGWEVVDCNWRTRYCEIDIIATRRRVLYFIEVKYRRSLNQGSGLDYITPRKLKAMRFAAAVWMASNRWRGGYELAAIEVTGPDFQVGELTLVG